MQRRLVDLSLIALILSGCATSSSKFYENPQAVGTLSLCRTWANAEKDGSNLLLASDTRAELYRRGITLESCESKNGIVKGVEVVGAIVGVIVVAAALAANSGGGGSYSANDYDWAWDQFYSADGRVVWSCRGKQTGRFADQYHCSNKPMNDYTWPGM